MYKPILINDHFQNWKTHNIQKAQLIIADIPYNLGNSAYASNPKWYVDGDNRNGESKLAGTQFFDTDKDFRPAEFMHFCSQMLIKEPKQPGRAPAMIIFCAAARVLLENHHTPTLFYQSTDKRIMTPEQFTAAYEALQEDKKIIEGEIEVLKQEYIESLPFKVGDCVRIDLGRRTIEKAWIAEIGVSAWNLNCVDLAINKPKKDGTRSNRRECEYCVRLSEVELIKGEG